MVENNDYVAWLNQNRYRIFLTVTLREYTKTPNGIMVFLTEEDVLRTAKYLRNGITRKLTGRRGRLDFDAFREGGSNGPMEIGKSPHLHILFDNPNNVLFRQLKTAIVPIIDKSLWTNVEWDIRPVYDQQGLLEYTLKKGPSSYLPEAAGRGWRAEEFRL